MTVRPRVPHSEPIDPVCLFHGKRWSEHEHGRCLYCCLCFDPLTIGECHVLPDGSREDVCNACAASEAIQGSIHA